MPAFGRVSTALVRAIDKSLVREALRLSAPSQVCLVTAQEQHARLIQVLREECRVFIEELSSDGLPDSVFIEDTAVALNDRVLLTVPGAPSRQPETATVRETLQKWGVSVFDMQKANEGARMDGGDVLFTGREFVVGLSHRTNVEGANVLQQAFSTIPVRQIDIKQFGDKTLHLKSACSMAGDGHILVGGEEGRAIADFALARGEFDYKTTHLTDSAAANVVFANSVCIRRCDHEFPKSADALRTIPGRVVQVEAGELAKVDGALTCCSLLLNPGVA